MIDMSLFAISDLHLALSVDKPMDIFGKRWENYMIRLEDNWSQTVAPEDTVLIPGDVSWATYLEDADEDFRFLHSLPGRKIITKGNHDYWWSTKNKMDKYLSERGFDSIHILHNSSYVYEDVCICGSRGWKCPGDEQFSAEDEKIYRRELQRLRLSLEEGKKAVKEKLIVMIHYPPFAPDGSPSEFVDIMSEYKVDLCIYGHLHGESWRGAFVGECSGVEFKLVSADYLEFMPIKIF